MTAYTATGAAPALVEPRAKNASSAQSAIWLYVFFFVSGFPALLYQIVWQRALFTLYGVNIESVTMVVTAFMLELAVWAVCWGGRSRALSICRFFGFLVWWNC